MKSNQGKAIWPYLAILASLFMLSVMAPRGWEQGAPVRTATPVEQNAASASIQAPPAIVRPSPTLVQAPELTPAAVPDDMADLDPPAQRAEPAEKVTSEHFVDSSAELAMRKPIFHRAPEPAATVAAPEPPAPTTPIVVAPVRTSRAPQALIDALTSLQEHAECQAWSRQALEHVEALTASPLVTTDSTATAAQHLAALDRLADEATKIAAHIKDIHVSTQLSRAVRVASEAGRLAVRLCDALTGGRQSGGKRQPFECSDRGRRTVGADRSGRSRLEAISDARRFASYRRGQLRAGFPQSNRDAGHLEADVERTAVGRSAQIFAVRHHRRVA